MVFKKKKGPSSVSPVLKSVANALRLDVIHSNCAKMPTSVAPQTEHDSTAQLLPSIVAANYGRCQTNR